MDSGKPREGFASRLGFILGSAGCAVGIGNVWRFPTVTGQNGGGVFVLFYLLFLVPMPTAQPALTRMKPRREAKPSRCLPESIKSLFSCGIAVWVYNKTRTSYYTCNFAGLQGVHSSVIIKNSEKVRKGELLCFVLNVITAKALPPRCWN